MILYPLSCCAREQGALEQAAVPAQRQADDLRSRLAEAQSNWQLAQAAADAAAQERSQLLQQVAQELNRASLVEQVCRMALTVQPPPCLYFSCSVCYSATSACSQQVELASFRVLTDQQARLVFDACAHSVCVVVMQEASTVSHLCAPLQALQQVFRQEVSNGRARCSQLQDTLHQRSTDLEAAQAQLATSREERAASEAEQQRLQGQLQDAQRGNLVLQQQMSQVRLDLCLAEHRAPYSSCRLVDCPNSLHRENGCAVLTCRPCLRCACAGPGGADQHAAAAGGVGVPCKSGQQRQAQQQLKCPRRPHA